MPTTPLGTVSQKTPDPAVTRLIVMHYVQQTTARNYDTCTAVQYSAGQTARPWLYDMLREWQWQ